MIIPFNLVSDVIDIQFTKKALISLTDEVIGLVNAFEEIVTLTILGVDNILLTLKWDICTRYLV